LAISSERLGHRQTRRTQSVPPERHLAIVSQESRRRVSVVVFAVAVVLTMVASVIGFQAFIAEQQLTLDRVSTDLRLAKLNYDELRQQRADLMAPDYLREKARLMRLMRMLQGIGSRFIEVPADVVADVVASTGLMDPKIADPAITAQPTIGGLENLMQPTESHP